VGVGLRRRCPLRDQRLPARRLPRPLAVTRPGRPPGAASSSEARSGGPG
jgi:hypothetical protein